MAKTTFTEKMLLEEVIANTTMSTAAKEKAKTMLEQIAKRTSNRKTSEKALAKAAADAETKAQILAIMENGKTYAANELTTLINKANGSELTSRKISSLAGALATEGKLSQKDGRFNGKPVKIYSLV